MLSSVAPFFLASLIVAALSPSSARADEVDLSACLRQLRTETTRHGVRPATFDRYTKAVEYDARRALPDVAQPEFTWPIWEYVGVLVDEQRVEDGRRFTQEHAAALAAIERRFGVDSATVVAILGVETNFGAQKPKYPVIETFVNRTCGFPEARAAFKREQKEQLFQALKMLQAGDVQEAEFLGSRAGAFGMTQFMPLTYAKDKADIDGDGHADIINSVPDALGSTARFLLRNGFTRGRPWAIAVELPAGFDTTLAAGGFDHASARKLKTIAQWRKRGVRFVDERVMGRNKTAYPALTDATQATLLLPEGPQGIAFLATSNFTAFWQYNNSDAYAFSVGLLADRLRGEPREITWVTGEVGLSRKEIAELQALLIKRGHDGVAADGVPGTLTREAVRAEQNRLGWPESGYIGVKLLETLRASSP
ncbi:MAG TPA: lytic murein transglycosylase [Burkholderiaceae bacterium]|nr:lytic murein transglycosylase [Burkholderiaceae bacterium]